MKFMMIRLGNKVFRIVWESCFIKLILNQKGGSFKQKKVPPGKEGPEEIKSCQYLIATLIYF